jgi:hypothetical protein
MVALAELIFISGGEYCCHLWAFYKKICARPQVRMVFGGAPPLQTLLFICSIESDKQSVEALHNRQVTAALVEAHNSITRV